MFFYFASIQCLTKTNPSSPTVFLDREHTFVVDNVQWVPGLHEHEDCSCMVYISIILLNVNLYIVIKFTAGTNPCLYHHRIKLKPI